MNLPRIHQCCQLWLEDALATRGKAGYGYERRRWSEVSSSPTPKAPIKSQLHRRASSRRVLFLQTCGVGHSKCRAPTGAFELVALEENEVSWVSCVPLSTHGRVRGGFHLADRNDPSYRMFLPNSKNSEFFRMTSVKTGLSSVLSCKLLLSPSTFLSDARWCIPAGLYPVQEMQHHTSQKAELVCTARFYPHSESSMYIDCNTEEPPALCVCHFEGDQEVV